MDDIKIFQSFHKGYIRNKNCKWITPVGVSGYLEEGFLSDNAGTNISSLNASYCELTTQYYAWKNSSSQYIGFFHYRRYLNFLIDDSINDSLIPGKKWYDPSPSLINYLTSDEQYQSLQKILEIFDVVTPTKNILTPSIREQYYLNTLNHEPWIEFINELEKKYKNAHSYFETVARAPICNMFIMKREIFNEYCSDLYPLIDSIYTRLGQSYDQQNNRYPGFLAERFLGFWLTANKIAHHEVPMVAFK